MVSFKNNTVHFLFQLRVCLKSDICCEVVRMVKHLCPYRIRSATRLVLARRFPDLCSLDIGYNDKCNDGENGIEHCENSASFAPTLS